jgi:hypothetical protein
MHAMTTSCFLLLSKCGQTFLKVHCQPSLVISRDIFSNMLDGVVSSIVKSNEESVPRTAPCFHPHFIFLFPICCPFKIHGNNEQQWTRQTRLRSVPSMHESRARQNCLCNDKEYPGLPGFPSHCFL